MPQTTSLADVLASLQERASLNTRAVEDTNEQLMRTQAASSARALTLERVTAQLERVNDDVRALAQALAQAQRLCEQICADGDVPVSLHVFDRVKVCEVP